MLDDEGGSEGGGGVPVMLMLVLSGGVLLLLTFDGSDGWGVRRDDERGRVGMGTVGDELVVGDGAAGLVVGGGTATIEWDEGVHWLLMS